jgi:adenosylcobinamide-phosphate synthase
VSSAVARRARETAFGLLLDRALGEPPARVHPVAAFGTLMTRVESALYTPTRGAGALYALGGVATGSFAGAVTRTTVGAVALATSGRELRATAQRVGRCLDAGDLDAARSLLPALVGRDPSRLDDSGVAAAVVESVAENTVDAVVAPAWWALVGGAPGVLAHRAVNTMDAMVGHRSPRYEAFGWGAARLDDVAAWIPARVTVGLVVAARPPARRAILRAVREDAPHHPSPNAGVAEAAFAGALGVELGGPLRYGTRDEVRPCLGRGPRPAPRHIGEAIRLADHVERVLVATLVTIAVMDAVRSRRRRERPTSANGAV